MMLEEYHRDIVMVNFGKVIYDLDPKTHPEAKPLLDYGHRQGIMDRLIKIERERQAILGYKAPSKRVLEVITADMFDKAIAQLNADAEALEAQSRAADDALGLQALNPAQRELESSIIDAEIVEDDLPDASTPGQRPVPQSVQTPRPQRTSALHTQREWVELCRNAAKPRSEAQNRPILSTRQRLNPQINST